MSLSDYRRFHVGTCAVCAQAPGEALAQIRAARSEPPGFRPGERTIVAFLDGDYGLKLTEPQVLYHLRKCL